MKNWKQKMRLFMAVGCVAVLSTAPLLTHAEELIGYSEWILDEDEGWKEDEEYDLATGSDSDKWATYSNACDKATLSNADEKWPFDAELEAVSGGVNYSNTCDEAVPGAALKEDGNSPDKTAYYQKDGQAAVLEFAFSNAIVEPFHVAQADVRFDGNGSGFTPKNKLNGKGNFGVCVRRHDEGGKSYLAIQTGGSSFTNLTEIDPDKWYRIALRGYYGEKGKYEKARMDLYLGEYDEDGNLIEQEDGIYYQVFENVNRRNDRSPLTLFFEGKISVDNVCAYEVAPAYIKVSAENDIKEVSANSTLQMSAVCHTALDEEMPAVTGSFGYEIYRNGKPVLYGTEITAEGLLKIAGSEPEGELLIKAVNKMNPSVYGEYILTVHAIDGLIVQKIGFNEDYSKLVRITANINRDFDTGIVFIVGVYDENGVMKTSFSKALEGDEINTEKPMEIYFDGMMPDDFDKETDVVKVFIWQK